MVSHWLQHPESMGAEAVEKLPQLIEQYPYCPAYRMLYCIALANTHSTELSRELEKTSCALPDRTQLFRLVNNGEHEWIKLLHEIEQLKRAEQEQAANDDSFELIEQYLSQQHLPEMELEGMMPSVATEFPLELLEKDASTADEADEVIVSTDTNSADDDLSLIDKFLSADNEGELLVPKPVASIQEVPTPEPNLIREKAFFTESLAKLYVKQHKYEQALAIFSQLNLQYSGKSSNFADQIRYLEKIIAFQKESGSSSGTQKF